MDRELIDRIVQEVKAALQTRNAQASPVAATPDAKATARTGDVFKTPAAASTGVVASPNLAGGSGQSGVASDSKIGKVFVTAEMLQQRLAGGAERGALELAPNEYLTPNAADLAEQKHLSVRQKARTPLAAAPQANPSTSPAPAAGNPVSQPPRSGSIGLVVDRPDQKVTSVISAVARAGLGLVDYSRTDCILRNTEALCEAIHSGQVACGVAMVPYAAGAMVLCGKLKGIRPVQGTRPESVAAGVRQFHANLLVLEHAFCTFHELRRMIQTFAARPSTGPTDQALMDAVARQEGP
ncbi:MAG TPA: RpiB/LacA/LacB family sugar-phosphate isomerase [Phycisphaerae bacterium]|nr:RpiB/LacA/LacB family sugar-phosphate isomerase [Phycisphaerae bacterium]